MTPAERARDWYPSASSGGGNAGTASGTFLWKPVSDSNGKAAVHTPANVRVTGIAVVGSSRVYGVNSYGNGYRPLFRLEKQGGGYGSNVQVIMYLHGGGTITVTVPSGGKRFEKSGFADHGETSTPPVNPPAVTPPATSSIELPASYAGKVGLVAIVQGRKFTPCTRDPANPARWTHPGRKASRYGIRWATRPGGSVATWNAGFLGLWSVTDGAKFLTLPEILAGLGIGGAPDATTPPPVVPPAPPTPPPVPPSNKDAELTATGLRLAHDLAGICKKVIIIEDAETNRTNPPKHLCARTGDEWSSGKPLSAYRAAVYQLWWTTPPRVPHHQNFMYNGSKVSHITQAGKWAPPTTRNP